MRNCEKCGANINLEEHHLHPKFMDNISGYGERVILCKKHHTILHLIIPSIIWKYLSAKDKKKCISEIRKFSNAFISEKEICPSKILKSKELKENDIKRILKFALEIGVLLDSETLKMLEKRKNPEEWIKKVANKTKSRIITKKMWDKKF